MGSLLFLLLLGAIVAVVYVVTSPAIAPIRQDRRVQETARIIALAWFAFLAGQALAELTDGVWKHAGPMQLAFYAASVACLLFLQIRSVWSRDRWTKFRSP
jgi:hypothetical protein